MPALVRICVGIALTMNLVVAGTATAEHHGHEKAIEQAVLNYVSALYDMKPELIDQRTDPALPRTG
jgi:hypothetical protein